MDQILTVLSKPIIITLLTLTIGSYLFTRLTERRAKRDKIRERVLQLFEDVGNDLNSVLSLVFSHIRNRNFEINREAPVYQKRGNLFTKRFSVRIKSKAFLQSDEFWKRYEQLTFEIDGIVKFMAALSENDNLADITKDIKARQEAFAKDWPLAKDPIISTYSPPSDELEVWADMIWNRAVRLLSENLNIVLR